MSSTRSALDVPSDAADVARRYRRVERPISAAVGLVVVGVAAVAFLLLPLLAGLLVVALAVGLVRIPVFTTGGTARLVTDADPESVAVDFGGATPPVLAFQWGIADEVVTTADGGVYEFSHLFGMRSFEMVVNTSSASAGDAAVRVIELDVTANGGPWGTYRTSIDDGDGETVVDVEWASERRFGLRYLPQWLLASRYRDDALAAQGYTTVERNASLSL